MTVRDWLDRRTPPAPSMLASQILAILGRDADADETRTAEVCLEAAARALDGLLSESRFARESALDLLAIDALTTYAYEHASQSPDAESSLRSLTDRGTRMLGQLMQQRV